ncbi:hypothetical protein HDU85_007661 [Gaertneriomyces sp. JEL0708]|nr:hypothetical protein HDU85_007661 [Gaertneriomyces sp. JEL0708]
MKMRSPRDTYDRRDQGSVSPPPRRGRDERRRYSTSPRRDRADSFGRDRPRHSERSPSPHGQRERRTERSLSRSRGERGDRFMNADRMKMLETDRGNGSKREPDRYPRNSRNDYYDRRASYDGREGDSDRLGRQRHSGQWSGGDRDLLDPRQGETFDEFLNRRRQARDNVAATIWPPSPENSPSRSVSPSPAKKSRSKKRRSGRRSEDDSSSSDSASGSESDDDRRSKRKKKDKKRKSSKRSSSQKRRSRKEKARSSTKEKSKSQRRRTRSPSASSSGNESVSDADRTRTVVRDKSPAKPESEPEIDDTVQDYWREKPVETVDDAPIGPVPMQVGDAKPDERAYGGALLAGEGSAMAAYVQSGKRIPRRGEIGLTSDEISSYETVGYVMSGNRHKRMNAVRIRKENQVISAEEKRALLLFNQEANLKKESEIIANFKDMVAAKLRGKEGSSSQDRD